MDRLLQFLVDSSGDGTEVVRCANCDLECGKQAGAPGVQWGGGGCQATLSQCHILRESPNSGLSALSKAPPIQNRGPILLVWRLKSR